MTVLEDVRVAVAANIVAGICALVNADVVALTQRVDAADDFEFDGENELSGRAAAITDN